VFSNLKNVFKVADLRNKILFVMAMVLVYRIGVAIRIPGIDPDQVKQFKAAANSQGALGFLNMFSGGAFASFSIFALGIMPYITASIIMQVLGVVIPKLEKLQQEGAVGQRKITQYTRYLAIGIAFLQATALTFIFGNGNGNAFFGAAQQLPTNLQLLPDGMWPRGYLAIITLVGGTAVLMWLGELISQRGIGNGMSMVIFASVVSDLPFNFYRVWQEKNWFVFTLLVLLCVGIVLAVVRVELAQRRIPVQFAKRVVGRRMYGGQSTYIPMKVNQAGVIPIIFASSLLMLPGMVGQGIGNVTVAAIVNSIASPEQLVHNILFAVLIVFFSFFYTAITFNPVELADNMKKYGGVIVGVRPGKATADYLNKVMTRITLVGSLFLTVVALLPAVVYVVLEVPDWMIVQFFGGTSLLILVGVALDTIKQIEQHLTMRHYDGFSGKGGGRIRSRRGA